MINSMKSLVVLYKFPNSKMNLSYIGKELL